MASKGYELNVSKLEVLHYSHCHYVLLSTKWIIDVWNLVAISLYSSTKHICSQKTITCNSNSRWAILIAGFWCDLISYCQVTILYTLELLTESPSHAIPLQWNACTNVSTRIGNAIFMWSVHALATEVQPSGNNQPLQYRYTIWSGLPPGSETLIHQKRSHAEWFPLVILKMWFGSYFVNRWLEVSNRQVEKPTVRQWI